MCYDTRAIVRWCLQWAESLLCVVVFLVEIVRLIVQPLAVRLDSQNLCAFAALALASCAATSATCHGPDLFLPAIVVVLSLPALVPRRRTYYVDSGVCDESFYERWSEYCVERQQQRQRIAAARRKFRNSARRWLHKMRRKQKHAELLKQLRCNLTFRRRTAASRFSRWLAGVLRRTDQKQQQQKSA